MLKAAGNFSIGRILGVTQAERHEFIQLIPVYLPKDQNANPLGYRADWLDERHHFRRFASEFLGTFGFVFALSGGAAILHGYASPALTNTSTVALLTLMAATWLIIAIYAFGDISAHFNPAMTFAFALRGDMSWKRAGLYVIVQCFAAACASGLARLFFGVASGLAAVHPPVGKSLAAFFFEILLTGLFVLLVLAMCRGPKLNGPFTPLAVAAYVMSFGTMGGLFEGAAFNPARAFGPDLATGRMNDLWVYVAGAACGVLIAVPIDRYLRGKATAAEAAVAESEPG